ncbi:type III pantothenate kinase [Oscillospiraceae bacterium PP1C4]
MILTIHVGNRTIWLGGYDGQDCAVSTSIGADPYATCDQYAATIRSVLAFRQADTDAIDGAVISSVVPALTRTMQNAARQLTNGKVLTVGAGMKTGLNLRLDNTVTVGSDFICNAVAALGEFKPPLAVISMTDVTTFTAIDAQGVMIGRSILPGVESALEHLCESSAQLPDVSFDLHADLIGRSTADAIKAGALHGAISMIEGMLERYIQSLGTHTTAVATGELAKVLVPLCRQEIHYRPQLLHDGLRMLYQKNKAFPEI